MPTPRFPIADLPASLPTTPISGDVDSRAIAEGVLKDLRSEYPTCFAEDGFWRDLWALTDNKRTFHGAETIKKAWSDCYKVHEPVKSSIDIKACHLMKIGPLQWIETHYTFTTVDTPARRFFGLLRIIPTQSKEFKIWILSTMLEEIEGHGHPDKLQPVTNPIWENGHHPVRNGQSNGAPDELSFDAVVVGAGPGGLAAAGRLKALGVNALTVEKNAEIGMNWTNRYKCLKMHTPRERNVLPFNSKYPHGTDYYISGDDMSSYYRAYASRYGLNIWLSTALVSAEWDEKTQFWSLTLQHEGKPVKIRTKHIILCSGRYATPYTPEYANRSAFKGTALHSSDYVSALELPETKKAGEKKAIVVGTANTAHDIADDLLLAGYTVTMIQRERTLVIPVYTLSDLFDPVYTETGDAEDADRATMLPPMGVVRKMAVGFFGAHFAGGPDKVLLDGLEKAGFKVERHVDLMQTLYEKQGKHYMDIGTSRKIVDGKIKVRSGVLPVEWVDGGLKMEDGSVEEADVMVFATGFRNDSKAITEKLVGEKMAGKFDEVFGVDAEGEPRGLYIPSGGECSSLGVDRGIAANVVNRSELLVLLGRLGRHTVLFEVHRAANQG